MGRDITTNASIRELESIYRAHLRRVRWVLRARGIADDVLDDLVHDVFLAIHRRLPERDERVPLAQWISGVARNVAFSHRRSEARERQGMRGLPEPRVPPTPHDALEHQGAWLELRAFLHELAPAQREVFVLSELLGMRVTEIAAHVEAPIDTLYSRLRLARRRFHDRFADRDAATWLQRAGRDEAPHRQRREAGWALLAVRLVPVTAAVAPIAAIGVGKALAAAAAIVVAIVLVGAVDPPPATSSPGAAATPISDTSPSVATREAESPALLAGPPGTRADPPTFDAALRPTPRPTSEPVAAHPSAAIDAPVSPSAADPGDATEPAASSLSQAVHTLREARRQLTAGRYADALATIDTHRSALEQGPLVRDMLGLEREAACRSGRRARAEAAHAGLRALGLAPGETPCSGSSSAP